MGPPQTASHIIFALLICVLFTELMCQAASLLGPAISALFHLAAAVHVCVRDPAALVLHPHVLSPFSHTVVFTAELV